MASTVVVRLSVRHSLLAIGVVCPDIYLYSYCVLKRLLVEPVLLSSLFFQVHIGAQYALLRPMPTPPRPISAC